ncbi:hypothetical protein [Kordia sp.]|uniref:hypothetical protein n=1 Tax=Kordia sp. TaxID=1965332 RepID=UPI003B5A92DC
MESIKKKRIDAFEEQRINDLNEVKGGANSFTTVSSTDLFITWISDFSEDRTGKAKTAQSPASN